MQNHENGETTNSNEAPQVDAQNHSGATDPVSDLQAKLKDAESKYVYLYADFENFKKRAVKERQDLVKFGWEGVATELLGVLDNLERALQFAPQGIDANFLSGVQMVAQGFKTTLEKQGVKTLETKGQPFNPELHDGIGQIPSTEPEGIIVEEQQKGYTLHGRLLRPARVLISSGKQS